MTETRRITDAELEELIALSDGPSVLHWGKLNRGLRELRESRWSPITQDNLPRVGDEILATDADMFVLMVTVEIECNFVERAKSGNFIKAFTHRRSLNAPAPPHTGAKYE